MTHENPRIDFLKNKAVNMTQGSGVYLMKNSKGSVIYVGKAKSLKNRVTSYFGSDKNHGIKVIAMVLHVYDFDYIITDNEFEALVLENSLIKQHKPKYNILLKDDKGYSYIKISAPPWSKISAVKQKDDDDSKYLGPYISSWSAKNIVDEVNKIFMLPTCNKNFGKNAPASRPCLNYYIKQCLAPCKGRTSEKQYRTLIGEALEFVNKGAVASIKELQNQMNELSENMEFEKAAIIRDRISAIQKINDKQKIVESSIPKQDVIAFATTGDKCAFTVLKFDKSRLCNRQDYIFENEKPELIMEEFLLRYYENNEVPPRVTVEFPPENSELLTKWLCEKAGRKVEIFTPQKGDQLSLLQMCKNNAAEKLTDGSTKKGRDVYALEELSKLLNLKKLPLYIESYDISNLSGGENVGAMIVYRDGKPHKKAYRKFKIKTIDGQDDYGSMREVLLRRFLRYDEKLDEDEGFGKLPDLILLDGGKGHVSVVKSTLVELGLDIPVFGMVKDNKHKTRAIATDGGEISVTSGRSAFTLISSIQEEVHRFAIGYHRVLRKKNTINSALLEIEGIGKSRATALLKHFKTIEKISLATLDELLLVNGMTEKAAKSVINYYKGSKI